MTLILVYFLVLEEDPKICEIADCDKDLAVEMCPKTCKNQKICKTADCTKLKSLELCPETCADSPKVDAGKKIKYSIQFRRLYRELPNGNINCIKHNRLKYF